MRVLHWYPNFLGGGGVANAVLGLATAQARAGAEVRIAVADEGSRGPYTPSAEDVGDLLLSWEPRWRRTLGPLVLRGIPERLRRDVRAFSPDVVHAHGEFNPDNVWPIRFSGAEALLVLSPHGAFDPAVFRKGRERAKALYARIARRVIYERLDAFHALSPREAEHTREVAPACTVYVVPQGGGPAASVPARGSCPEHDGAVELLFVGRLDVYTKGLDLLLHALAGVTRSAPVSARLTLVGPDWRGGRARLERLASALGIEDAVVFTGAVRAPEVARLLDRADCCVVASRHEGFSLSATEALVRGKPLILSRETGHASYPEIAELPHVLLVEPEVADIERAICAVAGDCARLRAQAARHQPRVAHFFSWERVAARHLDAYASLRSRH